MLALPVLNNLVIVRSRLDTIFFISSCCAVTKKLDCGLEVSKFEFHFFYYA